MERLLIIEDDEQLREGLEYLFLSEGYEVDCAGTKQDGLVRLHKNKVDAILLDCNLPDGNGFDLCSEIRRSSEIPILMLTARDSELDEVKALELGVDDYMSKPFSIAVLKTRLRKIIKPKEQKQLVSGTVAVNLKTCKVSRGEKEIELSAVEYRLLVYFMENAGQVLSKEQIIARVWDDDGESVDDNIVSVNIRRLRLKLEEDAKHPVLIQTVHGIGYIWKEQ